MDNLLEYEYSKQKFEELLEELTDIYEYQSKRIKALETALRGLKDVKP